jgi:hypothetical protein
MGATAQLARRLALVWPEMLGLVVVAVAAVALASSRLLRPRVSAIRSHRPRRPEPAKRKLKLCSCAIDGDEGSRDDDTI